MFARWFALMGAVTIVLVGLPAAAAPADAEATKLADKAIFEDYLNLRFGPAIKKLQKALTACERGCSSSVKARVFRDLGVVYVAKKEGNDSAIACFIEALTADPNIRLDQDLSSADAKKAFAEALAVVGEAPAAPQKNTDSSSADIDADAEMSPAEPEEDDAPPEIDHDAPKEQAVNTPLPLYLEVSHLKPSRMGKLELFYRPFGLKEFTRLPMKQHGTGWAAVISCQQIGTTTGNLVYYFVISGKDGQPLVTSGSAEKPFKTAIKNARKGKPPHLPDEDPPEECAQNADDCPPDFPGCAPTTNYDVPAEQESGEQLTQTSPLWLSLTIQADALFVPPSKAACAPNATYGCYYGGGKYRDPQDPPAGVLNADGTLEGAGKVNGGIALGTLRVMLGGDYAFTPHIVAGIKVGFAFLGGPQEKTATTQGPAFLPLHAEARVSYWFNEGISAGKLRPFAAVSGGLAQVDARVQAPIIDPAYAEDCAGQPQQCLERNVDAWRKTGIAFASVSGGALFAFEKNQAIFGELRVMQMFPTSGTALALHAGYMMNLSALPF